jgi:hypothetical protein
LEKLPGKLKNSGKTESAFFYMNGRNDLANFFLMFVIIRMRFLCNEKLEKLSGKLENSGKTESFFVMDMHNSFFCFVLYSREQVFRKKNRDNYYKGKSKNSGKLQKL